MMARSLDALSGALVAFWIGRDVTLGRASNRAESTRPCSLLSRPNQMPASPALIHSRPSVRKAGVIKVRRLCSADPYLGTAMRELEPDVLAVGELGTVCPAQRQRSR